MTSHLTKHVILTLTLFASVAVVQAQDAPVDDQKTPAPAVRFSSEEWNFGQKWYGEECSTEIKIENVGDAPLKILKIKSSCGCTAAKPKREELGPGESDVIVITYNTRKNKEQVSQTITIFTNDPERPHIAIVIKGVVKNIFDITPMPRITFGRISRDEKAEQKVTLKSNLDEPVNLKLKAPPEDSKFDVVLKPVEPGKAYELIAVTKPPMPLGSSTVAVELDPDIERVPPMTIHVSAYIAPRVYVRPVKLQVSKSIVREFVKTVRVYYTQSNPVEIKEVKSSHPDLIKVEQLPPRDPVNPKAATNFHELRVTLPPAADMPPDGGSVTIVTTDPDPEYQTFKINVSIYEPKARPIELAPASSEESEKD